MIVNIWYHISEKLPEKSGHYLCFKDVSIGDNYTDIGCYFFDVDQQYFKSHTWENVTYWADINFQEFESAPNKLTPAVSLAMANIESAIKNYRLFNTLTK